MEAAEAAELDGSEQRYCVKMKDVWNLLKQLEAAQLNVSIRHLPVELRSCVTYHCDALKAARWWPLPVVASACDG